MSQKRHGAMLAYVQIFINIGIGLAFTPFLVSHLGKSQYGVFSIVGSFAAYLTILDMGMNDSVVRHLVGYQTRGDSEGAASYLGTMMTLYVGIASMVVVAGLAIYQALPALFAKSLTPYEIVMLREMFLIAMATTALTIALNPIGALLYANERFVLMRVLEMLASFVTIAAICLFLVFGFQAVAVVAVTAVVNAAFLGYKLMYAVGRLHARFQFRAFQRALIRATMFYSAPIFIVVVVEQIYWKLDNIIVGAMISSSAVAVYAIGIMFNKYFMSFSTAISKVMLPEVVRRVERGATGAELTDLLIRISRVQALVLMLVLTGLVVFGESFIVLWLGEGYRTSYYVMLVTLTPYSLELVGNVRNIILQAKGLYWYRSAVIMTVSLLNIPLTIFLIHRVGIVGAAASTGLGIFIGYVSDNFVLQIKAQIEIRRFTWQLWSRILPVALACIAIGFGLNASMDNNWRTLVLKIAIYSAIYALLMWRFGMSPDEKRSASHIVRGFGRKQKQA